MKKALLVGINYINTDSHLQGCINDVNNMMNLLLSKGYYCKILTDVSTDKPSKQNIIACFDWLLQDNPNDMFFYYSGHVSHISIANDKIICLVDASLINGLTESDFKELLINKVQKNSRLICVIDACHSECLINLKYIYRVTSDPHKFSYSLNNSHETLGKIITISSCKDNQKSYEHFIDNQYQGALTYFFLKVVKTHTKFKTIIKNINSLMRSESLFNQNPCLSFGKSSDFDQTF